MFDGAQGLVAVPALIVLALALLIISTGKSQKISEERARQQREYLERHSRAENQDTVSEEFRGRADET